MVVVLFYFLGYFVAACLISSACMRVRYAIIKYINFVSPKRKILMTKHCYSTLYRPFNWTMVSLGIAVFFFEGEPVIVGGVALGGMAWLVNNTIALVKNIGDPTLTIKILPILYLSLPIAFIGVFGGFVVNLLWAISVHSSNYRGNTDVLRNYMR